MWLRDPVYDVGVKLYEEFGDSDIYKSIFRQGESDFSKRKLFDALKAIADEPEFDGIVETVPAVVIPNDFLIKKLRHERDQLYRQIDVNMYALAKARTDTSRREHAFQILRLQRKKQEVLDNIEYVELNGDLPKIKPKQDFTTPEIQRLYVQISKTRKRLERTDLRNRAKTEKLLNEKLVRLKELREVCDE